MEEQRQSRFERGVALLDAGHYEEAHCYLEESLEKEGYSEECYVAFAEACTLLYGANADERVEDDESDRDCLQDAGLIAMEQGIRHMQKGRYGRAIYKLREAVEIVPEVASGALLMALHKKAGQYVERKLFRKAIQLYDECMALEEDNPKTYYQRAWAHLHAGNVIQAQMDVRRAQEWFARAGNDTSVGQRSRENGECEAGIALTQTDVDVTTPLSMPQQTSLQVFHQLVSH